MGSTAFFTAVHGALPTPRPYNLFLDPLVGVLAIALNVAALIPPPTRRVRLMRAALAPFVVACWMWVGYVPILRSAQERWGTSLLLSKSLVSRC
jgi:hypothetical protein